eukprot:Plantae.Rhodophyta-Purpureofilum_apyrenoidigerum.ctg12353.p1 GENE.Plantae.Rhodophyta-Purpureofilum_apyrenoidigerum.ctg12353~~Plantae.Rhodophyta-Purpureofilum_apyrenoidigerum.ctg12353.p1  ORF type:complete len:464 (+),score=82.35 Plantae.Rhodophyta-Purpureofilum_apyrenoidigerum.ctg12353:117-1508(+)
MAAPPKAVSIDAKCADRDGVVRVTGEYVTWFPNKPGSESMKKVSVESIKNLQITPETSKKAKMRIQHSEGNLVLDFTTKTGRPEFTKRAAVHEAIQKSRKELQLQKQQESERSAKEAESAKSGTSKEAQQAAELAAASKSKVKLENNISSAEFKRRGDILKGSEEARQLYERLVEGGLVSDAHFWKFFSMKFSRSSLSKADYRPLDMKRGVPTTREDEAIESGTTEATFKLTPAKRNQIFLQYPEVRLAYRANVPQKMDERQFWEKYSRSRYFHKTGTATEADKLFAQYEKQAAEAIESELKARKAGLDLSLNLDRVDDHRIAHVKDLHEEGSFNLKNNMYLPKLKNLNRHGKLVLDSNAATESNRAFWKGDADDIEHPMPDLEEPEALHMQSLTLSNRAMFFKGIGQHTSINDPADRKRSFDAAQLSRVDRGLNSWKPDLSAYVKYLPSANDVYDELFREMS